MYTMFYFIYLFILCFIYFYIQKGGCIYVSLYVCSESMMMRMRMSLMIMMSMMIMMSKEELRSKIGYLDVSIPTLGSSSGDN